MPQHGFQPQCRLVMLLVAVSLARLCATVHPAEPPTPLYIQADFMERLPALKRLRFQGMVDIKYGDSHVVADAVELNTETGDGVAEGHVRFADPQHQIMAERAEFNLFTRLGTLYQATGSLRGISPVHRKGEVPQPVTFYLTAEQVVREKEERFRLKRGTLTTCVGPSPVWQFQARDSSVEIDGYAHLRHATFWIKNVPVFYTPYFLYPTKTERATGLLPPGFGSSERLGFFLDNRFFWAINEQSDSTIGVDYLSKRGIRPSLEYRYALSDTDYSQFNGIFLDDDVTGKHFWKVTGTSRHTLPSQVRGILTLDLVNRDNYDRTFEVEDLFLRTRRATNSFVALVRNWENLGLALHTQQLEDVESRADERLMRYPTARLHLLPALLPWGPLRLRLDAEGTNFRLDRTSALGAGLDGRRFTFQPQVAWTYALRPWVSITPFLGLHETLFDGAGQALEVQSAPRIGAELQGPQVARLFGAGSATRYKHIVEPRLTYTWIPPFTEKTRRQPFDILDDVFPRNDVAVSVTNRLYARSHADDDRFQIRELALLRISQGLDLRGQKGEEFTRLAPGPFFADLAFEARVQLTSTLTLRGDAAYNHDTGQFDIANAGLSLYPLPALRLSLERRFRRDPTIDFINGGVGLSLPQGWSLNYTTGYNARDNTFAGNVITVLYRPQCWNLGLQMVQRPDETRFTVQIGLDAFLLPKLGF